MISAGKFQRLDMRPGLSQIGTKALRLRAQVWKIGPTPRHKERRRFSPHPGQGRGGGLIAKCGIA
jgi:hypothetical protein